MTMLFRNLVCLPILLGTGLAALSQDTGNTIAAVSIASPTAASLGKYGDIPVSYRTGVPDIHIPIYTVESGSLKLPLTLSYHADGLKTQENASWVGAGWSLNAGGVITRTVVGAADDRGNNAGNNYVTNGYYSDLGFESYLNGAGGNTPDDLNFARGAKDGEPDLYFFNFGGYSGKFYFNDDRTPMLLPDQDLKIQPYLQIGPGFLGFILTTPDGTKYYFGETGNDNPSVNPIEYTVAATAQAGYNAPNSATSSWYLNKILSADGIDSINLTYQPETYSYYALAPTPVLNSNYVPTGGGPNQVGYNVVKNFITGVRLSKISFPNGTVSFTPASAPRSDLSAGSPVTEALTDDANTSAYALGSVTITNNQGLCKKDSLYYDYFYDGTSLASSNFMQLYNEYNIHSDEYKLRLDSLKETSCDGTLAVPPYKFSYFGGIVPRRLSFAIDHWGYANGSSGNTTLVPSFNVVSSTGAGTLYSGAIRDAAWPAMEDGTLQQITYPTGGTTTFSFAPKAVYPYSYSQIAENELTALIVNMNGQDQLTMTNNFTVSGNGAPVTISEQYTSNQPITLNIVNSSNQNVFTYTFSGNYLDSFPFPAGTYTATLAVQDTQRLSGGAYVMITQLGYITTQTTITVGGLRIGSITNNDALTSTNVVTTYNYLDNDINSFTNDILYSIPTYVQVYRNDALGAVWPYCSPNGCASCDGTGAHSYYISGGSLMPMSTLQGENLGYTQVQVSQSGNGYSLYQYYPSAIYTNNGGNLTDVCVRTLQQTSICSLSIPSYPYAPVPFEPMREELSYEGHFSQNGHVLKENYFYPVYVTDSLQTPGHINVNVPGIWSYTEYMLQSMKKVQDRVVQNTYDPVSGAKVSTASTSYYASNFHHQATRKVTTTSSGDSLATNISYALDFRIASCDAVPDSLPYYLTAVHNDSAWMDTAIVNCTPQVDNINNCRSTIFTQFREDLMQARQQLIAYRRRSFASDTANLVSTCYLNALPTADTLLKPILRLQYMFQNAPIETSQWRDLKLLHAGFTRYDSSISPLGFAYPGRSKLINLQAPSLTFSPAVVSGHTISKDSRYTDETLFSFSNGKPQQVIPHSLDTVAYLWDYLNTEPIAKASNAAQASIAYTSFESNGNGSWTIPSGTRDNSYAITGSSSYNLTNGNVSRSGLISGNTYVVSYWSKTGSSYTVTGSTAVQQGKTISINGTWTYFEHTVTGVSTVTISGSGDIDELRLYPATAQMTTYTYTPLVGMTSECDADNRITYYFYDALGRLNVIKDQDGNIVKTYQYHYLGQPGN